MENLVDNVFNELKKRNLVHISETIDSVKRTGMVFTKAVRNQEIKDALSNIENISLNAENFSGFSNGIAFTIKPFSY